jgi:hypothetical protein
MTNGSTMVVADESAVIDLSAATGRRSRVSENSEIDWQHGLIKFGATDLELISGGALLIGLESKPLASGLNVLMSHNASVTINKRWDDLGDAFTVSSASDPTGTVTLTVPGDAITVTTSKPLTAANSLRIRNGTITVANRRNAGMYYSAKLAITRNVST